MVSTIPELKSGATRTGGMNSTGDATERNPCLGRGNCQIYRNKPSSPQQLVGWCPLTTLWLRQ
jgi:hypothetical protein